MSFQELQPESSAQQALKRYHKGMKDLGRSLIILSVLQLAVAGLVLAISAKETFLLAILGGMAALHLLFGILLLQRHFWVNYLVALWGAAILVLNCMMLGSAETPQRGAGSTGSLVGIFIAIAFIYYANKNLQEYKRLRGGNLQP